MAWAPSSARPAAWASPLPSTIPSGPCPRSSRPRHRTRPRGQCAFAFSCPPVPFLIANVCPFDVSLCVSVRLWAWTAAGSRPWCTKSYVTGAGGTECLHQAASTPCHILLQQSRYKRAQCGCPEAPSSCTTRRRRWAGPPSVMPPRPPGSGPSPISCLWWCVHTHTPSRCKRASHPVCYVWRV